MNPFTTDHPLASKSSWFDMREHPRLSFICSTVWVALILAPLALVGLHCYAIDDIGAGPDPFFETLWGLFWASAIAFLFAVCGAVPIVCLCRLLLRTWR